VNPRSARKPEATVRAIYRKLSRAWGQQHWWPAETPFEVIVGAILTQNTSWTNVERAMANLRSTGALNVESIRELALPKLEEMVRSSGYFRQKAQRLKSFVAFLDARYGGSLEQMFATLTEQLREELLKQNGIGPETADSILLYAGGHEIFVIDAYTRRILERHLAVAGGAKYDEIRNLIERALQREQPMESCPSSRQVRPQVHEASAMSTAQRSPLAQVYNEMHGLLVQVGKHYCLKQQPKCEVCPLGSVRPISIEQSVAGSRSRKTKAAGVQASPANTARKGKDVIVF
jgi:endonuclease-3 related protein